MSESDKSEALSSSHDERDEKREEKERLKRYGRYILEMGKRKSPAQARIVNKVPVRDRERIARNIGLQMERLKVDRKALSRTKTCKDAGISPQELYRLVIPSEEGIVRADRLRADIRKYQPVILGIAELTKMDPDILAHRVATGTSIHPVSSLNQDGLQQIIHTLYEITDKIDTKFDLSERFSILSARKRMLSQDEPFACWPNGTCFRAENGEKDPFQFNYWRIGEDDIEVWNEDLMVEDTSLHHFVRYLPHLLLGVYPDFDSYWAISEKDIPNGVADFFWGATLDQHKHANAIQRSNRERLAEFVGDPSVQRVSWDNERLLINDLPEEEYVSRNQQHMMAYFEEVGLQPDWGRDRGEVVCEHAVWLCLYPSWQSDGGRVTNLIPVIAGNYGGAGANGELVVAEAEAVISESFVKQTLLGGKTILERLEEVLWISDSRAVPEVISELERTALFIEEHPLLKRHRRLDMGMKYIADWGNAVEEHKV